MNEATLPGSPSLKALESTGIYPACISFCILSQLVAGEAQCYARHTLGNRDIIALLAWTDVDHTAALQETRCSGMKAPESLSDHIEW
jgi:hypothetical protein